MAWIRQSEELSLADLAQVGGRHAALGELARHLGPQGLQVPAGFVVTAEGYRHFLEANRLEAAVRQRAAALAALPEAELGPACQALRELLLQAPLPDDLAGQLLAAYRALPGGAEAGVAVRASAVLGAAFADQLEHLPGVRGEAALLDAVRRAFASLFTVRAVRRRRVLGPGAEDAAVSVGVQRLVRADRASAGTALTQDAETGHPGVVLVTSSYGLGEGVAQGLAAPDQFYVHKAALRAGFRPLVRRRLGAKEARLVSAERGGVRPEPVAAAERARFSLADAEVLQVARMALAVEAHLGRALGRDTAVEVEWAQDGPGGPLYLLQARPVAGPASAARASLSFARVECRGETPLVSGVAVGDGVAVGLARRARDLAEAEGLGPGQILVAARTDPDWDAALARAAGLVVERGGRTSHAAEVARERGIPALVGAEGALARLADGQEVTLSCAEGEVGHVYAGRVPHTVETIDLAGLVRPRTRILLAVERPEQAFKLAQLPSDGVGLARIERILADSIGAHPLALAWFSTLRGAARDAVERLTEGYADKPRFFVERLSEGISTLAAAFWPRPVVVRFSDFHSGEFARLQGGAVFEFPEDNPLLGWRGASRYCHSDYRAGFRLEVQAVKRVWEEFGLRNLKVAVPFCRTPEEGQRVLEVMAEAGLRRSPDGPEVLVMAEVPSTCLEAADFAPLFDGFTIGSDNLTQLTLGVDRAAERLAGLFDERRPAVKALCALLIREAHRLGKPVGLCGRGLADYPEFAAFLVEQGIDSLSVEPEALVPTLRRVAEEEARVPGAGAPA